jgi:tol-pal system protein YbgF
MNRSIRYNGIALVFLVAVISIWLSGCAMKRDIVVVDEKINNVRTDQKNIKASVDRLDSLLTNESDASIKLRAEVRSAVNDLISYFQMMQANMSDLQEKVDYLAQQGSSTQGRMMQPIVKPVDTSSAATGVPVTPPGINCQELYDESFIIMRRGEYEEAIASFNDYLKYCGAHESADNARFWLGDAYYTLDRFHEAISEFDLLLRDHPDSEKRPSAMWKMARSYEKMNQIANAREIFQKLVDDFPNSLHADEANEKLKILGKP